MENDEPIEDKPKSHKENFINLLRKEDGDESKEYTDDDLWNQSGERWDALKQEYTLQKETVDKLAEVMAENPDTAAFINQIAMGVDPIKAIGLIYGDMSELMDEESLEAYNEGRKTAAENFNKQRGLMAEQNANIDNYDKELDKYASENGYDEKEKDQIHSKILEMVDDISMGKISTNIIETAAKSLFYDKDIEEAAEIGLVEGRNQKIDVKLKDKDKKQKTDGLPNIQSSKGGEVTPKINRNRASESILDGFPI